MQQKYIEQFQELYSEDMHVLQMPLMEEEVRGVTALEAFSEMLLNPYVAPEPPSDVNPYQRVQELEAEVVELRKQLASK